MEVHLSPTQQTQLSKLAAQRGADETSVASEILGRALEHEEWFVREVDKGFQSLDRGQFIEHHDLEARIAKRLKRQ